MLLDGGGRRAQTVHDVLVELVGLMERRWSPGRRKGEGRGSRRGGEAAVVAVDVGHDGEGGQVVPIRRRLDTRRGAAAGGRRLAAVDLIGRRRQRDERRRAGELVEDGRVEGGVDSLGRMFVAGRSCCRTSGGSILKRRDSVRKLLEDLEGVGCREAPDDVVDVGRRVRAEELVKLRFGVVLSVVVVTASAGCPQWLLLLFLSSVQDLVHILFIWPDWIDSDSGG